MLANFILFQIGWFACVPGGANDRPWLGAGIVLAIVALAVGWAVLTPLLVRLARRFDGYVPTDAAGVEPQARHA